MNIRELISSGRRVITLLDRNRALHGNERKVDPILFGFLEAQFGGISRQHPVPMSGSTHPKRIDYRRGGNNPVVIELAVQPRRRTNTLYGSQNTSELRKLCRISSACLRVLLLLDLSDSATERAPLQATYSEQTAGRGNFRRHSVRVVYVHRQTSYHFIWRPTKMSA